MVLLGAILALLAISLFLIPMLLQSSYSFSGAVSEEVLRPKVSHVGVPDSVKAIYMTSWVAGTPSLRANLIKLLDDTEANAVVIDIKDYTGNISFEVHDPDLQAIGSVDPRIADIDELIQMLHDKNIYVIGRLSVFQDAFMTKHQPGWAVKRASDGAVWKDRKGISWIDPGSKDMWKYIVLVANESYNRGFDEINFDYIRFPSDGDMKNIAYPYSQGIGKPEVMRSFFQYLREQLNDTGMIISADLFGMVTTNTDDLGIGQVLENALPYFDYVAPMVYPSHYPATWNGLKNPAEHPYEVIKLSMGPAVARATALGISPLKLRPWLQDFDLGATYTADMVRKQIQATYDVGLTSWMLWDASNTYTPGGLLPE